MQIYKLKKLRVNPLKTAVFFAILYTNQGRRAVNAKGETMDRNKTLEEVLKELNNTLIELNETVAGINRDLREILGKEAD